MQTDGFNCFNSNRQMFVYLTSVRESESASICKQCDMPWHVNCISIELEIFDGASRSNMFPLCNFTMHSHSRLPKRRRSHSHFRKLYMWIGWILIKIDTDRVSDCVVVIVDQPPIIWMSFKWLTTVASRNVMTSRFTRNAVCGATHKQTNTAALTGGGGDTVQ